MSTASDSAVKSFDFIVNRRGGTVLREGEGKVREDVLSRFGDRAGTFTYVEGAEIAQTVRDWAAANAGQNRGLVIGGGDGTVNTAVQQLLGREDITLGILPLGTQNLLARQLGFSTDFRKAASQYKKGHSADLDVGEVNGMPFLVAITLDQNSVNYFIGREDARNRKHFSAVRKKFSAAAGIMRGASREFRVFSQKEGSRYIKSSLLIITNNTIVPRPIKRLPLTRVSYRKTIANIIGKGEEATGELSLYGLNGGLLKGAALLPALLRGKWTSSSIIDKAAAPNFYIDAPGARIKPFILDGEIKQAQYPLDVRILPKALRVFKPD